MSVVSEENKTCSCPFKSNFSLVLLVDGNKLRHWAVRFTIYKHAGSKWLRDREWTQSEHTPIAFFQRPTSILTSKSKQGCDVMHWLYCDDSEGYYRAAGWGGEKGGTRQCFPTDRNNLELIGRVRGMCPDVLQPGSRVLTVTGNDRLRLPHC